VNILCIDQFTQSGGAQRCLTDLLPAFIKCGWRVHLAAPGEGSFLSTARACGIETHVFHSYPYRNGHKSSLELARYAHDLIRVALTVQRIANGNNVDLLYVNGPRFLPAAAIAARSSSLPLIFHCHNRVTQRAALLVVRAALRLAHAKVIACCKYVAEPIRARMQDGQLSIVYNGVNAIASTPAETFRTSRTIGVIGRIEEEKGQLDFVLAARALFKQLPDCRFLVVGAPLFSDSNYVHKVMEASHDLPIQFLGWRDDIAAVLSTLDLLVVPSSPIDATTRVIIEAFAAGVPVVAFPSGGIPEVVFDEQTGFLARAHTPDALAERIVSVLSMPSERLKFVVDLARKRWRENYTLDAYRQRVLEVISEAADRSLIHRSPWKTVGNKVHA
jgi:glycosyltransferase involved in cell wall biosynthesis